MKFGIEFNQRSVSRWKNYNIDYNLLKSLIRDATSEVDDSSSSDSSDHSLTASQKKLLKKLYKSFQDQVDFVSLFVFSKVGEISRRLMALKRQCNMFIESNGDVEPVTKVSKRIRERKLLAFHRELDLITKELQDLSRFILLQKIAIKKLLKKFLKHSMYSQKEAFVSKIKNKCLTENPKSFVHLNLNDLTYETTLLYEFLDTFLKNFNKAPAQKLQPNQQPRDRQNSTATIDTLNLTTSSYGIKNSERNEQLFPKSTTFDVISKRKGPRSFQFWVHNDNLDQIKFLLTSEFKLITDETPFAHDTRLKSTRSSLNLSGEAEGTKIKPNNSHQRKTSNDEFFGKKETVISNEEFCPETDSVSVWLNNKSNLKFVQTTSLDDFDVKVDSNENLNVFCASPYSQIIVSNTKLNVNSNLLSYPVLVTPVGGLRQFTISALNEIMVDTMFPLDNGKSNEERKKELYQLWSDSKLPGNKQLSQLSIDWVIDNKVEPLASVSSKKLRYINLDDNEKINFFISLEWDISITTTKESGKESKNVYKFPHAILEINYDLPEQSFPENIKLLIDSYLVYRVDNLNFSLNNFLIYQLIQEDGDVHISDAQMLLFIAPWHGALEAEIRILPELRAKSQGAIDLGVHNPKTSDNASVSDGILLNSNEIVPQKPGYWNEFDNGSDYGGDENAFYVYVDSSNGGGGIFSWLTRFFSYNENKFSHVDSYLENNNDRGLEWLSNDKAGMVLNWVKKARNLKQWLDFNILGVHDAPKAEMRSLLNSQNKRYSFGSINDRYNDTYDDSETEYDDFAGLSGFKPNRSDILLKGDHDNCLSFLYLTMIMFSVITSSIGAFIISSLFNGSNIGKPQFTHTVIGLIFFSIICLILSVILTGFSICFMLSRYTSAPLWHTVVVWTGSLLSIIFFLDGITTFFV